MTTTCIPMAMVAMTWDVHVSGRVLGGEVRIPDCAGAVELMTRLLAKKLKKEHGFTAQDFDGPHVFIFRRVE